VAPAAGVVTTVIGEPGQTVETGRALAAVLPHNAVLEAHLYAPSRAMGFVEIGDAVLLRYAAYPYQKFGHHAGTVSAIARAPLPAGDLLGASLAGSNGEPLYRIVVAIESQAISAYGRSLPLQAGMAVEADVLLETRRLYEWVLDPLYAWARTMHAKPLVPPPGRTDQD
jgi:membrane fusion protein